MIDLLQYELQGMADGSVQVCHYRLVDGERQGCGAGKYVDNMDEAYQWVMHHECPR